jgi:hypothetical protein
MILLPTPSPSLAAARGTNGFRTIAQVSPLARKVTVSIYTLIDFSFALAFFYFTTVKLFLLEQLR